MITFCLTIFLLRSFTLFIKGLLGFFGMIGDGVEGWLEGFWGTVIGLAMIICGVIAFIKLYNIHLSFG